MQHILMQATKDWSEFRRDRLSLSLAFLLPLITLLLFGYGVRMQSHDIPIAIEDRSMSSLSRAFIERLQGTSLLRPFACPPDGCIEKAIENGKAKAGIIIPADFTREVLLRRGSSVQVLIDGTDIINARLIGATVDGATHYLLASVGLEHRKLPIDEGLRVWFNPGLREELFIVPGVYGVVLWMFPCLLSCVAIARERDQGTIMQAYVSRISAHEFIIGKALVYVLIGLSEAALILFLGFALFGITFKGNPLLFLITLPIFVSCSVLFGIAVGTWSNSQTTAVQAVSSLAFFTCLLLSGFVYPISNIPFPLSLFSYLVPARYFIEVSRWVFERGVGWSSVWINPVVLFAFCCALLVSSWAGWRAMQLKE